MPKSSPRSKAGDTPVPIPGPAEAEDRTTQILALLNITLYTVGDVLEGADPRIVRGMQLSGCQAEGTDLVLYPIAMPAIRVVNFSVELGADGAITVFGDPDRQQKLVLAPYSQKAVAETVAALNAQPSTKM